MGKSKKAKLKKAREGSTRAATKSMSTLRREDIASCVARIVPGKKVKIRFSIFSAVADLGYLASMFSQGQIDVSPQQSIIFVAILESYDWGPNTNRTVQFKATESFDRGFFEGRIMQRIDYIDVE